MRRLALLSLLTLAACADETPLAGAPLGWGPASGATGTIVGEWQYCYDASCVDPAWSGVQFADGVLRNLWLPEPWAALFCVGDPTGTYSWDGRTLTISDGKDAFPLGCGVSFTGEIAHLSCQGEDSYLARFHGQRENPCVY